MSDLDRAAALVLARGSVLGQPLHLLSETGSTNDLAKQAAKAGAVHGTTWVAESQTAGRGRQGRSWVSPAGDNLLFSVLWKKPCPTARLPLLSLAAGLAVCEVARELVRVRDEQQPDVRIKWPNDVVVVDQVKDGARTLRKLAGILVETSMTAGQVDGVVVGIGLNVHTLELPPEVADLATSLARLTRAPLDRAAILVDLLLALDRVTTLVAGSGLGALRAPLAAWDALRGERVESELGAGVAEGIDGEGRLLVIGSDGTRMAWGAGEVHLRRGE